MVKSLAVLLGRKVAVKSGGLVFFCLVQDIRVVWGNVQILVKPMAGQGSAWRAYDEAMLVAKEGV
jgi:hypothetical protein